MKVKTKSASMKTKPSTQVHMGKQNSHVKVPVDGKNLLKMHIAHAMIKHMGLD